GGSGPAPPTRQVSNGVEYSVGVDCTYQICRAELTGLHQRPLQPCCLSAANISVDAVADHEDLAACESKPLTCSQKELSVRFAEHDRLFARGVFRADHERRAAQRRAAPRQPVASHAQGYELRIRV